MKICIIETCHRKSDDSMCRLHQSAKDNLEMVFFQWKTAYGPSYSWEKYLKTLMKDTVITGEMVEDIIKNELEESKE